MPGASSSGKLPPRSGKQPSSNLAALRARALLRWRAIFWKHPALMPEPIIVLDGLQKSYRDTRAVDGISLSIGAGEIFGFLGANGAGKTTTMRMLCGLVKPSGGSARIAGHDVWRERHEVRTKFGYVAQKFSLYPDLTVAENLRFFGGAYRVPRERLGPRIETLLGEMNLTAKRDAFAGALSGGMKQLLALACALIHEPVLLFLDEPTSGLDPVHRQQIWDLLYNLAHNGTTVFVTTHYMDEAERCTSVGFLHSGRLLARETPRRLKQSFKVPVLDMHVEPVMPALVQLRAAPGVLGVSLRSGHGRVYAADPRKLVADWQERWPFPDLTWHGHTWAEPDMEDVFKAYSQGYHEILAEAAP
jgi:ABC-2 type transport system ATP-binding protein